LVGRAQRAVKEIKIIEIEEEREQDSGTKRPHDKKEKQLNLEIQFNLRFFLCYRGQAFSSVVFLYRVVLLMCPVILSCGKEGNTSKVPTIKEGKPTADSKQEEIKRDK